MTENAFTYSFTEMSIREIRKRSEHQSHDLDVSTLDHLPGMNNKASKGGLYSYQSSST